MTPEALPAATIILLRETDTALKVFMQERHRDTKAFSSMLVFPGGKVHAGDRHTDWRSYCSGSDDTDAEQLAHQVAAIRETFEECGVLLARADGEEELLGGERVAGLAAYRARLQADELCFIELVQQQRLRLACDKLAYFARWITPQFESRRFDTRFFLVRVPPSQQELLRHDGYEAVNSIWIDPQQAVADAKAGRRKLIFPTIRNLERLAQYPTVALAQQGCAATPVMTIEPVVEEREDGVYVRIPKDAAYPVCEERIPDAVLKMLLAGKA
jgi:8-oxo-dGTP pyrophosphatase MutT (NUDIX family)